MFDQINAALVSLRDLFQSINTSYWAQTLKQASKTPQYIQRKYF